MACARCISRTLNPGHVIGSAGTHEPGAVTQPPPNSLLPRSVVGSEYVGAVTRVLAVLL